MPKQFEFTGVLVIKGDDLSRQDAQRVAREFERALATNNALMFDKWSVKFTLLPGVARTSE